MAQFTLNWDNTAALANANAIAQRASYRRRSTMGAFITSGFTPNNDLPKSAVTTQSPVLVDNVVYQFKVETLCTVNGPTINDNGIQEQMKFACITPEIVESDTTSAISIDVTNTDITKARFRLKKTSDNSTIFGPSIVNTVANTVSITATGLTASTAYYWQVEFYATVNGVEVISSAVGYLNSVCGNYASTTTSLLSCSAPEDLVVTNS